MAKYPPSSHLNQHLQHLHVEIPLHPEGDAAGGAAGVAEEGEEAAEETEEGALPEGGRWLALALPVST